MTVRTRFAPSPTGYLHVGGARTALFCYLFARHHSGEFLLRIEDTDQDRSTETSVQAIFDGLNWLDIEYDNEPVFQSNRTERYQEFIDQLLDSGHAYRCYCSKERLEEVRKSQFQKGLPGYDGHCRDLDKAPADAPAPVIRFRNPADGSVRFTDLVKGPIEKANSHLNDFVMVRADGTPTYNFAVVIDDLDMEISHIIRGDDHLDNTSSQINVYRALGHEPPEFAHVPMILGDDGERLSKRHGALNVMQYRVDGFLPDALLNYLVRLGWSHGDQEIFSRDELIELFDLDDVNKAPSRFNSEKLMWLNQHYIQHGEEEQVTMELSFHLRQRGIEPAEGPPIEDVWRLLAQRADTMVELADQADFLYREFEDYEERAARKQLRPEAEEIITKLGRAFTELEDWDAESIQAAIQGVVDDLGVGFGKVGQPLRVAVSGRSAAPSNDQMLAVLGRKQTLKRLSRALDYIERRKASEA